MSVNIGKSNISDPFYRYKMPAVVVTHEKKKTNCDNIQNVARALQRTPEEIMKFFSITLGCSHTVGKKFTLTGIFSSTKLQDVLEDYISLFVMCDTCSLPETKYTVGETLSKVCSSCGADTEVDHKLVNFIKKLS